MRTTIFGILSSCALVGCALVNDVGANKRTVVLMAPESFRAKGEPWEISDLGGWQISRAKGCLRPDETVQVEVLQKMTLIAQVPGSSVVIDPFEDDAVPIEITDLSEGGASAALVTGSGTPNDPFVVKWRNLHRWQGFVDSWLRYPTERIEIYRSREEYMEFEADADRLKSIETVESLQDFFSERPDIKESYNLWLSRWGYEPYVGCS